MPIISAFFGILIRIYHEDHNPPHFHVEYAEHRAVVEIATGRTLGGKLPRRAAQLVREWRSLNEARLERAWKEAQAGKIPRRVPPLE